MDMSPRDSSGEAKHANTTEGEGEGEGEASLLPTPPMLPHTSGGVMQFSELKNKRPPQATDVSSSSSPSLEEQRHRSYQSTTSSASLSSGASASSGQPHADSWQSALPSRRNLTQSTSTPNLLLAGVSTSAGASSSFAYGSSSAGATASTSAGGGAAAAGHGRRERRASFGLPPPRAGAYPNVRSPTSPSLYMARLSMKSPSARSASAGSSMRFSHGHGQGGARFGHVSRRRASSPDLTAALAHSLRGRAGSSASEAAASVVAAASASVPHSGSSPVMHFTHDGVLRPWPSGRGRDSPAVGELAPPEEHAQHNAAFLDTRPGASLARRASHPDLDPARAAAAAHFPLSAHFSERSPWQPETVAEGTEKGGPHVRRALQCSTPREATVVYPSRRYVTAPPSPTDGTTSLNFASSGGTGIALDAQPPLPPATSLRTATAGSKSGKGGGPSGAAAGALDTQGAAASGGAPMPAPFRTPTRRHSRTMARAAQAAAIGGWLNDHFQTKVDASLPRSTPYDCYLMACRESSAEPLNAASFGKHIRLAFSDLKVRRLGTRGQSRYHYQGIMLRLDSPYHGKLPASALGSMGASPSRSRAPTDGCNDVYGELTADGRPGELGGTAGMPPGAAAAGRVDSQVPSVNDSGLLQLAPFPTTSKLALPTMHLEDKVCAAPQGGGRPGGMEGGRGLHCSFSYAPHRSFLFPSS